MEKAKDLSFSKCSRQAWRGGTNVGQGRLVGRAGSRTPRRHHAKDRSAYFQAFIRDGVVRGRNGSSNHPAVDGSCAIGRHDSLPASIAAPSTDDDQPTRPTPDSKSNPNAGHGRSTVMTRPPFEVADIIRTAGPQFRQRYWRALTWPQIQSSQCHCPLPHFGSWWPSRPMRSLRISTPPVSLVP